MVPHSIFYTTVVVVIVINRDTPAWAAANILAIENEAIYACKDEFFTYTEWHFIAQEIHWSKELPVKMALRNELVVFVFPLGSPWDFSHVGDGTLELVSSFAYLD